MALASADQVAAPRSLSPAEDPAADSYVVNLTELARVTGISTNTLRATLAEHADFPVLERGSNGRPYLFDSRDVAAWLRRRDALAQSEADRRRDELARQQAELFGSSEADEGGRVLTAKERRDAAEAELAQMRVAREKRELVRADQVEIAAEAALVVLQRGLLAWPDQVARELGLDRAARLKLDDMVAAVLNDLADKMAGLADTAKGRDLVG